MNRTAPMPNARAAVRRWVCGAVLVGIVTGPALAPGTAAAGHERTSSPTVAAAAERTLVALERWQDDRTPASYVRFAQGRSVVAELLADELGIGADPIRRAWSGAPIEKQHALLAAMSQLGVPYDEFASDPGVGFDCSGLTQWAFAEAGVDIPRSSRLQYRAAERVDDDDAEPGDLVYYPGHISMYLGEGLMVHSPTHGGNVEAGPMSDRSVTFVDAVDAD